MTRPAPPLLGHAEIDRQLVDLPGVWVTPDGSLAVTLRAPSFPEAIRLVQIVAAGAEQMDHHPDISIRWRTVRFTLSTHSAGGITQLDIDLAHQILEAARQVIAETVPVERGHGT